MTEIALFPQGPDWLGRDQVSYLAHTVGGLSFRQIARVSGCEPSTILRAVRRVEQSRDDPICDALLDRLSQAPHPRRSSVQLKTQTPPAMLPDRATLDAEALRVLPALADPLTCLAIAPGLDMSVVVREARDGRTDRVLSVERSVAEAFVLKGWVEGTSSARVSRYRLSASGRSFLKTQGQRSGLSEAPARFDHAPGVVSFPMTPSDTPLAGLARRRQSDGTPFLPDDLVNAGERLREDFEIAQMEPGLTQNWETVLTGRVDGGAARAGRPSGPAAARARVQSALADLGPGLGDVVLRCCCFLEGLEQAERRLGWSARSGKVVLRIALQRLKRHYDELGDSAAMIG